MPRVYLSEVRRHVWTNIDNPGRKANNEETVIKLASEETEYVQTQSHTDGTDLC